MLQKDIRGIKSFQPLYIRLYEHLRNYIDSDIARKDGKLPTEMELCRIFRVSRNTVTQALAMLEQEQLICRIKHRGTFLTSAVNEFDPQSIRRTVGGVFPGNSPWEEAVTAIRKGCRNLGYDFHYYTYCLNDISDELQQLERAQRLSCGIILYPGQNGTDIDNIRKIAGKFPLVLFDLHVIGFECNSVATDHYLGAYALAETLIVRGCRKFCLLDDNRKISSIKLRRAGFLQALADYGLPFSPEDVRDDNHSENFSAFLMQNKYDALLDVSEHIFSSPPSKKKICLARFDSITNGEKEFFHTAVAEQNKAALGDSAINLMKTVLRSGITPARKILIAPQIIFS